MISDDTDRRRDGSDTSRWGAKKRHSIGEIIEGHATRTPQKVARRFEDVTVTYEDLNVRSNAYSNSLEALGLRRPPHVMFEGYYKNPEAMVAATKNLWLRSGDLRKLDEAGNLTYVDRKKDSIRRREANISSVEVETSVLS